MSKYIIIDADAILKRIEELEKEKASNLTQNLVGFANQNEGEISALKQILSQSTPLIPEIEKAFGLGAANNAIGKPSLSDYITNLKLDI